MNDFKYLYMQAKKGRSTDISSYLEAIKSTFDKPLDYILNLEYIIQSDAGLKTLKPFIEKYGLPIASYDNVVDLIEECCHKCESQGKDDSLYKESLSYMQEYKDKFHGAFDMFNYYNEDVSSDYIKTYYSFTNGIQNRYIPKGMFDKFKEAAIPDLIIASHLAGSTASAKMESYINDLENVWDSMFCEWVDHACKGTNVHPDINANKLSSIVDDFINRQDQAFRESVILNHDMQYEYTEEEISALRNLISFKEYVMLGLENSDDINALSKEIYNLYEHFPESVMDEECSDIVQLLPESLTDTNASHKKTGNVPDYIGKNHDPAKWGEEDDEPVEDTPANKTLDDYKRPSAKDDDKEDGIKPYDGPTGVDKVDKSDDKMTDLAKDLDHTAPNSKERQQAIQNIYYYTYNNSLNKTTNDNHAVHSVKDDHSTNKRVNSDNINDKDNKEDNEFRGLERKIWELDLSPFIEEVGDADDNKPTSDNPIRDTMIDVDRAMMKGQQKAKKAVQSVVTTGKAIAKPFVRTKDWITSVINNWKDKNETELKEKMVDPHSRSTLFSALRKAIRTGALIKAGILTTPVFAFLAIRNAATKGKRDFRIRNEIIGELKTEMEIIDEKIKDASAKGDNKAKYELMRFKNELKKKLLRVEGGSKVRKMI